MARKARRFSAATSSRRELAFVGQGRQGDVDQPVGAVQPAPQIVVLAIGAAEEGAEAVELDALERRRGAALADRDRVVGRDAVDLDRVELVEPLALQQGQGGDVVEGIAEIGEDQPAPVRLGQVGQRSRSAARRSARRAACRSQRRASVGHRRGRILPRRPRGCDGSARRALRARDDDSARAGR